MRVDAVIAEPGARFRFAASFFWWPALFGGAVAALAAARASVDPVIAFNAVYVALAGAIFVLERVFPHEPAW